MMEFVKSIFSGIVVSVFEHFFLKTNKIPKVIMELKDIAPEGIERADDFKKFTIEKYGKPISESDYWVLVKWQNKHHVSDRIMKNAEEFWQIERRKIKISWTKWEVFQYDILKYTIITLLVAIACIPLLLIFYNKLKWLLMAIFFVVTVSVPLFYLLTISKEIVAGNIVNRSFHSNKKYKKR